MKRKRRNKKFHEKKISKSQNFRKLENERVKKERKIKISRKKRKMN